MSTPAPQPVKYDTKPPVGIATLAGFGVALAAAIGAIVAGIDGNDTATATAGGVAALSLVTTLGGRYAQAVAAIRSAAVVAGPWIDAFQAAMASTPAPAPVAPAPISPVPAPATVGGVDPGNPTGDLDNSVLAPVDGDVDEVTTGPPIDETRSAPEKE